MNTKKKVAALGLLALLGSSAVWAGGPWHDAYRGRYEPDYRAHFDRGHHYGWDRHWDRRPVTVVRERTVIYRDWAPPPRVVEYRYARPYYEPGVTIDVSPIFIPFR
ncbi:hypothetical protein [Tepidiphilus margaritifer]|uniref:hypothetical protein n=1 Tax=Tepidiphilus margaritifer TaxID=203471 RepID=UPI0003FC0EC3|nr:hypothetical protein [Tepidiphilus margaritifer]